MYNIDSTMITENIQKIKERIAAVAQRIKRDPKEITLVCVTKGRSVEQIREVIASGLKYIGENRIQEALLKYGQLSAARFPQTDIQWQMIGHLQTNKVKDAVNIFDLIHSVDSLKLAEEIDRQAAKINKLQDILIEVKTSPEATKFGVAPEETPRLIEQITQLKNLRVKGLMTIAPFVDNVSQTRPYFSKLRQLRDQLNSGWLLSMGMSSDFEVAIEEGADMIRLGRIIFENNV